MAKYYIGLPNGKRVSPAQYARAIKMAKEHPGVWFQDGLDGWGAYGKTIYNEFRYRTLHDIINRRGGLEIRQISDVRLLRKRAKHLRIACAWCGAPIEKTELWMFDPHHHAFCGQGCQNNYWGY